MKLCMVLLVLLALGAQAQTVTVTAYDSRAGEPLTGAGAGQFRFTRADATATQTVAFVRGGTATSNLDYTMGGSTVSFAVNQLVTTKLVSVVDDAIAEGDETVIVSIGSSSATVTILDDDAPIETSTSTTSTSTTVEPTTTSTSTTTTTTSTTARNVVIAWDWPTVNSDGSRSPPVVDVIVEWTPIESWPPSNSAIVPAPSNLNARGEAVLTNLSSGGYFVRCRARNANGGVSESGVLAVSPEGAGGPSLQELELSP